MTRSRTAEQTRPTEEAPSGVLLYLPFSRLPEDPAEMLDRLSSACGIHSGDWRYKLVGRGLMRLTPQLPLKVQESLALEMQDLGIPAAVVPERMIRRRMSLPVARRVEISDTEVVFFDRHDEPALKIDKSVDLLVVAADLSGRSVPKPFLSPNIEQPLGERSFEESLKKIAVARPAALFCSIGADPPKWVLVENSKFSYQSMEEYMQLSAGVNFRTLIHETVGRARTAITDHRFGAAALAGAKPDFKGSRNDILAALGRYALYLLAAAESGVIRPGGDVTADASYIGTSDDSADQSDSREEDDEAEAIENQLKPPPEMQHSGIWARIAATPHEILYSAVFGLSPFFSLFVRSGDFNNPLFWETATGIAMLGAGLFLFPYSLVVLHYKRMVENTPTSRVRSLSMGITELEGRARQYYDLKTSHSQTRCVYFRCRYFRRQTASLGSRWNRYTPGEGAKWKLVRETGSGRLPFYLEDDTGRVLIRPKGALFHITQTRQEFAGAESLWLPAAIRQNNTRIHEELIPEGARIYVLGTARPERVGRSFSEKMVDQLRNLKSDQQRLMEYDANGDGRIDMAEWETARADIEKQAYAESLMNSAPGERVVIKKPAYGLLPFIIADSEEGIIRKLSWRVWIFMLGGLLLTGLGVEMLVRLWG